MSLNFVYILANSADADEMLPYTEFHFGLHCLPKYLFTGIKNENAQCAAIESSPRGYKT